MDEIYFKIEAEEIYTLGEIRDKLLRRGLGAIAEQLTHMIEEIHRRPLDTKRPVGSHEEESE